VSSKSENKQEKMKPPSERDAHAARSMAEQLTSGLPPPVTDHERITRSLFKIEIMLEQLRDARIIDKAFENEVQRNLWLIEHWRRLNRPNIILDEEEREKVEVSSLNEWLRLHDLSEDVRIFKSE
jgi:hypothetical protein